MLQELSCGGYEQKVEKCDFDVTGQYLASLVSDLHPLTIILMYTSDT